MSKELDRNFKSGARAVLILIDIGDPGGLSITDFSPIEETGRLGNNWGP